MKISILVEVNQAGESFRAGYNVPDAFLHMFQGVRAGDVPLISRVLGEIPPEAVEEKMYLRKGVAEKIAAELAKTILDAMMGRDTFNGYAVEKGMSIEEQVSMMEGQLEHLGSLWEKMHYMTEYLSNDPEFSKEARDIVRNNIARDLK